MEITLTSYPEEVKKLQHLAEKYHLRLILPDGYMIGKDFAIKISVDREEARIWYYDAQSLPDIQWYALDFLIYRKRMTTKPKVPPNSSNLERVGWELKQSIEDMATYVPDVLKGSREWLKEYEWNATPLLGTTRNLIADYIQNKR